MLDWNHAFSRTAFQILPQGGLLETKIGSYIDAGEPAGFHEWERHGRPARCPQLENRMPLPHQRPFALDVAEVISEVEGLQAELAQKVLEGLRDDAYLAAQDLVVAVFLQEDEIERALS